MSEFDLGKLASDLIGQFAVPAIEQATSLTAEQIKKIKASLGFGFDEYLRHTLARCNKVKTLLYRDQSVPLERIYVPTHFESQGKDINEDAFFEMLSRSKGAIVVGSAGSGKTLFVKSSVLRLVRLKQKKIPIFVELRHINHFSTSIMHYILENVLKDSMQSFDANTLHYCFKSGLFTLVLDGFDEVNHDRRGKYLEEISLFRNRYKDLEIIISTRPEEATLSLDRFDIFHVKPLPKPVACMLIERLDYEPELKGDFIAHLDQRIYDQHPEFASSPLLLTMLLLTFDQIGDVPKKMHIFFNQAFETLVLKHDRMKALYQRKTYSQLTMDEIKKVYSMFCATSYSLDELSFTEERLESLLADALRFYDLNAETVDLKSDLISNYCMLKRDGLFVTFVHRSFQEYFCAYFLSRTDEVDLLQVIDALSERGKSELCLDMLYDMSPERVLLKWVYPKLVEMARKLNSLDAPNDVIGFLNAVYYGVRIGGNNRLYTGPRRPEFEQIELCLRLLSDRLDNIPSQRLLQTHGPLDEAQLANFFGWVSPFHGELVEPTSDDRAWLAGSWIVRQLSAFKKFIAAALDYLGALDKARRQNSHLFSKTVAQTPVLTWSAHFIAEGPWGRKFIDPTTNEARIASARKDLVRTAITVRSKPSR